MNNENAKGFIHLHVHTKGSLADAMLKEDELAKTVKKLGMKSVAITDHGNMFNAIRFYKACKREGIKPIIGMETYVAPRSNTLKQHKLDDANYHLVLLAENNEGYQNLINIASDASINGMYYKARTDKVKLKKWSKGIIALSACLGGEVQQCLLEEDYKRARDTALMYDSIFGRGNFYLELQSHGIQEQVTVNELLIKMSKETGIPLVCTNDCHYLSNEDNKAHDILMAIQAKTTIFDKKRKIYSSDQFYVKSPEEMWELFNYVPEALENTVKISERCNVEIDFKSNKLPPFRTPEDFEGTNLEYLKQLVRKGIQRLYGKITDEIKERAEYEINVVNDMGYVNYFLITWDFFRFCEEGTDEPGMPISKDWTPILTGPGRGCFLPNTKILLQNGKYKYIQNIEKGDKVVTHTGEAFPVKALLNYDCNEKITTLKACNEILKCTSDHKILAIKTTPCVVKGGKSANLCKPTCSKAHSCKKAFYNDYKEEWVEAKNLSKDDLVVYPTNMSSNKGIVFDMRDFVKNDSGYVYDDNYVWRRSDIKVKRFVQFDENLAKLLGYYIAEGYSEHSEDVSKYRVGFGFNKAETSFVEDIIYLMRQCFGLDNVNVEPHATRNSVQVIVYNKILASFFLSLCNKYSNNIQIPDVVVENGEDHLLKILISYMFRGDGSRLKKEKYNRIKYSTTSEHLAYQLRMLLARFGYWASIKTRQKRGNWSTEYSVLLSGKQLIKWNDDFPGYPIIIKSAKFLRNDGFYFYNSRFYVKVKEVDTEEYVGKVYDLHVPPNTSYVADSMCVHNSGAGSILLYSLGITKIDPLHYDLLFERFLDPSRVSMPDVDSDFEYERRQEVIDYVIRKYGRQSVCQIITYGTLAARAAIRAVGRALDLPYSVQDQTAKMIPIEPGITIKEGLERNPDFKRKYDSDKTVKLLVDMAIRLEGLPTYTGTHAAGVLITDERGVTAHVPVWANEGAIVSQYDMGILEELGLLKMDFLGLRTLGVVREAMDMIYKNYGTEVNLDELYKCRDLKPLKLLEEGKTDGIFQTENGGMTEFIKELRPKSMEEWIAAISLYRPGPMQFIPTYLSNRRNPENVEYPFPELSGILKETYGVLTYQEQCMRTVIAVAGYDKSDSDSFRKVIAKKKKELIPLHKKWFIDGRNSVDLDEYGKQKNYGHPIEGGLALGHDKHSLEKFFDKMEDFGRYAFNKSHAASYAVVGYVTAWFKYYYPVEFMSALMNSVQGNQKKISRYVNHCRKDLSIDVIAPDINVSTDKFMPVKDKIMFTLNAKHVSVNALDSINEQRKIAPFESFEDLVIRNIEGLGKQDINALASTGALSSIGVVSSQIVAGVEDIADRISKTKQAGKRAQNSNRAFNIKEWMKINDCIPHGIKEFPNRVKWALEKKYLGLYLTGHPIYDYMYYVEQYSNFKLSEMDYEIDEETGMVILSSPLPSSKSVRFVGMFTDIKETVTRAKKEKMAITEVEDLTGSAKMMVWPNIYAKYEELIKEDDVLDIWGHIKVEPDEPPIIILESLSKLELPQIKKLIIRNDDPIELRKIVEKIRYDRFHKGETPVYVECGNIRLLLDNKCWVNLKTVDLSGLEYKVINK